MMVPEGRLDTVVLNRSVCSSGPVVWGVVLLPYAVVVPNWNDTFVDAPRGLSDPFSVADVAPMVDAAAVSTELGWYPPANRPSGSVPLVNRKNGVPVAPPWHAAPSALNGFAVQLEEIGL